MRILPSKSTKSKKSDKIDQQVPPRSAYGLGIDYLRRISNSSSVVFSIGCASIHPHVKNTPSTYRTFEQADGRQLLAVAKKGIALKGSNLISTPLFLNLQGK